MSEVYDQNNDREWMRDIDPATPVEEQLLQRIASSFSNGVDAAGFWPAAIAYDGLRAASPEAITVVQPADAPSIESAAPPAPEPPRYPRLIFGPPGTGKVTWGFGF